MQLVRFYDSRVEYDSPLGYGWDHVYNHRLFRFPDGSVIVRTPGGERRHFLKTGGQFQAPAGFPSELIDNGDGTLTLIDLRGIENHFDVRGRLARQTYRDLGWLQFSYDPGGRLPLVGVPRHRFPASSTPGVVALDYRLLRVDEFDNTGAPTGRFIQLLYDTNGRLEGAQDHAGTLVQYTHDTLGNLTGAAYDPALTLSYAYADPMDPHNVTTFDATGGSCVNCAGTFVNTYDASDRVVRQVHNGGITDVAYTVPLVRTTVTYTVRDQLGTTLRTGVEVYEFDANGNVTLRRDALGHEVRYTRSADGLPTHQEFYEKPAAGPLILRGAIDTTYDSLGRAVTKVFDKTTGETITEAYTYFFDQIESIRIFSSAAPTRIFRTDYEFNLLASGRPANISRVKRAIAEDASGVPTAWSETRLEYNARGEQERVIYPNGDTYVTEYLPDGLVHKRYNLADPLRAVTYSYDARGFPAGRTDGNGGVQTMEYDPLGRPVRHTNARGEMAVLTWQGLTLAQLEEGISGTGPGRITSYSYTSSLDPARLTGIARGGQVIAAYTYDSDNERLTARDASGNGTTFSYDPRGNLASISDGRRTHTFVYDYAGHVARMSDGLNADVDVALTHDFLGNRLSLTYPGAQPVTYTYDAVDNMTSLTDAAGRTASFTFDLESQLTQIVRPLTNPETFAWTPRGRLDFKIDAAGRKIDYEYDPFGRIASMLWFPTAGAVAPDRTISFTYDRNDNLLAVGDSLLAPGQQLLEYTYDALNRVATTGSDLHNKLTSYDYDAIGQRTSLTLDDGGTAATWVYTYSPLGQIASIQAPTGAGQSENWTFTYEPSGRISEALYPGGMKQTFAYFPDGRLQTMRNIRPDQSILASYGYSWDSAGNLSGMSDPLGASTFSYDARYRLMSASYSDGSAESFTYDVLGNRLTRTTGAGTESYAYNIRNQLAAVSGAATAIFSWDTAGNLSSQNVAGEGVTSFGYDYLNRLTSITGTLTASYEYDPFNRLVSSVEGGASRRYVHDEMDLLLEMDGTGTAVARYTTALGVDDLLGRYLPGTGQSQHFLTSHLGSVEYITDPAGAVLNSYRYSAFGNAVSTETVASSFGYTARSTPDKKLYNYRARWYAPRWGRFLQEDPLKYSAGYNFYAYASNHPLQTIDPFGLLTIVVPGTWWSEDAWNANADFVKQVGRTFGETPIILGKDVWSGDNTDSARRNAAKALVDLINRKRRAGEPVNVVAHSHGGNVSAIASADTQITNLVTLGTPVRGDYTFNHNNINTHIHGYSTNDLVQVNGDLDAWHFLYQFFTPPAGREVPGAINVDTGVDTGPLDSHTDLWRDLNTWKNSIVPKLPPGTDCENGGGNK